MLRVVISSLLLSFFWLSSTNASPVDTFQFNDETTELRFQILSKELRCPKCQNQNLADSNSKIAIDLRKNLYNLLQEGKTDQEIIDFMVYRYGDFVLYRPPLKEQTYILWFGPVIILFGFIMGVVFVLRKRSKVKANEHDLSAQEQTNLDDILNKK
tara:strand:- start:525 stop:992 length:468 start_codon:yes stop_codon:yes gene_type:complete